MSPASIQLPISHNNQAYIPGLQCLRGIAAIAVVIAHITYAQQQQFPDHKAFLPQITSFWGVDIFFVLSGFVITYITANTPAGAANAKYFLLCRLIRIVPAYWFYTLLSFFIAYVVGEHINFKELWQSLLFIKPGFPLLMVGWTLTYEMLFYLLYSFFLVFLNNKQRALAVSSILFVLVLIRISTNISNVYFKFYSNPILLEFVFGLLIGSLPTSSLRNFRLPKLSIIAGSIALCISGAALELDTLIQFRVILWGLPAALIVWGVLNIQQTRQWILLEKLGNISYSIYLIHIPIISAVAIALHQLLDPSTNPVAIYCIFSLLFTITLAGISYKFIEKDAGRWLKNISGVH